MSLMPLKAVPISPSDYQGTLAHLTEQHLRSVMPEPSSVESIHRHLNAYWRKKRHSCCSDTRKSKSVALDLVTKNGAVIRWTDNSPAWEMHHAAFQGFTWTASGFDSFVRAIPCKMFAVKNGSINKNKWYVAHIFPVKADRRRHRNDSTQSASLVLLETYIPPITSTFPVPQDKWETLW